VALRTQARILAVAIFYLFTKNRKNAHFALFVQSLSQLLY